MCSPVNFCGYSEGIICHTGTMIIYTVIIFLSTQIYDILHIYICSIYIYPLINIIVRRHAHTHIYMLSSGTHKITIFMGNSTINGHFQQLCQFTRGYYILNIPKYVCQQRFRPQALRRGSPGSAPVPTLELRGAAGGCWAAEGMGSEALNISWLIGYIMVI